jgi:hypothetical protein
MNKRAVKRPEDNTARNIFLSVLAFAVLAAIAYFSLKPLPLNATCDPLIDVACTCPSDPNDINRRNLFIVDTTDPLRAGKIADIEELLKTFASGSKDLIEWLRNGKKPDQTSVYLLSNVAPADMRPIAIFCSQPPEISLVLGNTGRKIRQLQELNSSKVSSALQKLEGGKSAEQSPIVETLAILTSNSTAWRPGGTLILASDLYQNTNKCGFFESVQRVSSVGSLPSACLQDVRSLQEKVRPSSTYPSPSVVALCELPGKTRKEGLIGFWREIFQEPLGSDVLFTCDAREIIQRRISLTDFSK